MATACCLGEHLTLSTPLEYLKASYVRESKQLQLTLLGTSHKAHFHYIHLPAAPVHGFRGAHSTRAKVPCPAAGAGIHGRLNWYQYNESTEFSTAALG